MVAVLTKALNDETDIDIGSVPVVPRGPYLTLYVLGNGTTITAGTVVLEASADGTNWFIIATRALTAIGFFADVLTEAHRFLRARISVAIVGTGSPSVDAWIMTAPPGFGAVDDRDLSAGAA